MYIMHMAPENKVKKSLFIPSGKPSATCTVCYMSPRARPCWEALFRGRALLEGRAQVGQIALERAGAPRGINALIMPSGLRLAARAGVHQRLGTGGWRGIGESEQRQRTARGFRRDTGLGGGDREEERGRRASSCATGSARLTHCGRGASWPEKFPLNEYKKHCTQTGKARSPLTAHGTLKVFTMCSCQLASLKNAMGCRP